MPEAYDVNEPVRLIPFTVEDIRENVDQVPIGVQMIEAPEIWEEADEGEGVIVAILDTGIDTNHPDLKDRIIGGKNFTPEGSSEDVYDGNGHGTHVAGIIAANADGYGIVGVAPKAQLLILKVLTSQGYGDFSWVVNAINYAVDWRGPKGERVRAINLSLGGPEKVSSMEKAIKRAIAAQIPVVVAAGNEGDSDEETWEFAYPGNYNEVIEVAASTLTNELADFSNNNDQVDIIAPGVDILSTWPGGNYARLSGTSMAAPHVTGAIALLINIAEARVKRTLTEAEIYAAIAKRTYPLGYKASSEGHGLLKLNYMNKLRKLLGYIEENF